MKNNEELGFRFILNKLIKLLGGYTKTELEKYRLTIRKQLNKMKCETKLNETEKLILRQYREDMLIRKGNIAINRDRRIK